MSRVEVSSEWNSFFCFFLLSFEQSFRSTSLPHGVPVSIVHLCLILEALGVVQVDVCIGLFAVLSCIPSFSWRPSAFYNCLPVYVAIPMIALFALFCHFIFVFSLSLPLSRRWSAAVFGLRWCTGWLRLGEFTSTKVVVGGGSYSWMGTTYGSIDWFASFGLWFDF